MTIKYSIDFISDLDAIESIYRDVLLIPDSGKRIIAEILNVCDSIGVFPLIGIDLNSMTNQHRTFAVSFALPPQAERKQL